MSQEKENKPKVTRKDIAWWIYLIIMIALVVYGFWNSEGAEGLLRAIREAFSLLMEQTMEQLKEFVLKHFKVITVVLTFVLTMYIQHLNNTREIEELINKCQLLDAKIADQYERIDSIKLDKAVFEATITQFTSIQNDLHEIREDLRALLEHNAVCGK